MTSSAAMKIYHVAKKTDRRDFRIEDMLFTGVFREKAQVKNITGLETPGKFSIVYNPSFSYKLFFSLRTFPISEAKEY